MLELRHISKTFAGCHVLNNVDLVINDGEFFSILGPSGCGKTTMLRIIAGLETPDEGCVLFNGKDDTQVPAQKRPFNMVFQRYSLFPHLSVNENIAFGPTLKKISPKEIAIMTEEALRLVRLQGYGQRRVTTLSGGEQQRVSLARALVMRPQMLLLDEPLSALDLKLRQQMQAELHALQKELKITFIFVTHDQDEALTLSDRIAVMSKGDVLQLGTPQEIYHHPQSSFVAQFIGNTNSLPVQCTGHENGLSSFSTPGGRVLWARRGGQMDNGDKGVLFIRPEHISLQKSRNGAAMHGSIKDILFKGAYIHYVVGLNGEGEHIFHIHVPEHKKVNAGIGERISLSWISEDAILFPHIQ